MRLIDADALIKWCVYCADDDIVRVNRQAMISMLEHAPTVDAEPVRHGHWLSIGNTGLASCQCGYITDRNKTYRYCPNCGAKMQGDNDGNK